MHTVRIPLKPYSRFHFGEFKTDENVALSTTTSFAHSDTMFSALINSYSSQFIDTEAFINSFHDDKLSISSLFYYLKKDNTVVYLLPKPVFLDIYTPRDGNHKSRNRIQFVSSGVWNMGFKPSDWIKRDEKTNTIGLNTENYALIQNGQILLTRKEFDNFGLKEESTIFSFIDTPKSPIRAHKNAAIYYQADVEISEIKNIEIGCYFLYNHSDDEVEMKFKTAVNILSFSGIGGEKANTGRAMGKPEFDSDFTINFSIKGNYIDSFTNLSLINPKDQNELDKITFSKVILRGGRPKHDGSQDLNVVKMVKEGAMIKGSITGRLVKIGEDLQKREVWRNGKSFIIPIKILQDE